MDNINELASALSKAQAKLKAAKENATNPHFKSKYADLSAIWDACRDALTSNGLAVVQLPLSDDAGRVGLMTVLMHTSGQSISSSFFVAPAQNTPQGVGSALTYLRRYGLSAMVGIVADDDDDGNAASKAKPATQNPETIWTRWYKLVLRAENLGIQPPILDDAASDEDVVAEGKKLLAIVTAAEKKQQLDH